MRLFEFLAGLALLCTIATSAAVSMIPDGGDGITTKIYQNWLEGRAPKLEHPPPGHMKQKRDGQKMFTFGGYSTSISGDGKFEKLQEPIEANGHPHPWCQGFNGSNGYTEGQEPTIHYAHMDHAEHKSDVPTVPQFICFFYNNFDCDPSKGGTGNAKFNISHTFLTDLDMKSKDGDQYSIENRNFPMQNKDTSNNRYLWIKAYGCMKYIDAPNADGNTAQGATAELELSAADLNSGLVLSKYDTLNEQRQS
ncbi:uncharacterized protein N0V89_006212 [Didymosphaeria variabile]|uniref:Uncharacterized protein n=1 Tax=Didymosphaeria variabile TaxID=1932322 RepID=A0A9W8XM45_9PLEO|nr:uncharacterized protein N0V89_006212 [Didymosphaeria variabile]KAJ4354475.1 hypothetical protein N0V89_006212 [Didymosphaeria variabile]